MVEYKRKIKQTFVDKDLNIKERIEIKKEKTSNAQRSYQYLNIGFYLITPLLVGVFCGVYLDKRTGSHSFIIIGLLIGVLGTFYNLFRLTNIK